MAKCVLEEPDYYGGTSTCEKLYNCCDCGTGNCGCCYCWTCNACDNCNPICEGHESLNGADMGNSVYCDGSCS